MLSRAAGSGEGDQSGLCVVGWPFRYVHDLAALLYGLWARGLDTARELEEVAVLTSYASEARYPGLAEPVTPDEYDQAVRLAARVVTWAEQIIR